MGEFFEAAWNWKSQIIAIILFIVGVDVIYNLRKAIWAYKDNDRKKFNSSFITSGLGLLFFVGLVIYIS